MARLGLSRSEAEVTLALAKGATLAEIAESRGVARVTVRDQIRAAMGKASVHRQVDLVRLVLELRRCDRT
jgi:DNA-binding CsgD family transcriptional regulator